MTRRLGDLSQELMDRARDFYIENDISLEELAGQSERLFGQAISRPALERISTQDRWPVLKTRHRYGLEGIPASQEDEAETIRRIVADMIMDADNPPSATTLPSLVRAWMDLRNIAGAFQDFSAKTSRQRALEIIEEERGLNDNNS